MRAKALVFEDPLSSALLERIRRIAPSDATALIVGETGTGKEIVARHLHALVSTGRYRDLSISEWMHVPAVAVAVGNNLTVLAEYVNWRRYTPSGNVLIDRSVDLTLNGHF